MKDPRTKMRVRSCAPACLCKRGCRVPGSENQSIADDDGDNGEASEDGWLGWIRLLRRRGRVE